MKNDEVCSQTYCNSNVENYDGKPDDFVGHEKKTFL
jgi:hypothetical protein